MATRDEPIPPAFQLTHLESLVRSARHLPNRGQIVPEKGRLNFLPGPDEVVLSVNRFAAEAP
jgi:hypothetical protein